MLESHSGFFVSVEITLSAEQLARAIAEATRRQTENEQRRLKGRNRAPAKGRAALELHTLGCTGEVAVAAFLGLEDQLFQEKTAKRGSTDLPGKVEVKTRKKHGYDLLLPLDEDPGKLVVLVTCDREADPRKTRIVGWTYAGPVMLKQYVREFVRGRPCYAVPNHLLYPVETLKDELQEPAGPGRVLGSDDAWLTKEGDDLFLNLSESLLHELGWVPGTALEWSFREDTKAVRLARPSND